MSEISILFCDTTFEHDVYELIRAFYAGWEVKTVYPGTIKAQEIMAVCSAGQEGSLSVLPQDTLFFMVKWTEDEYRIRFFYAPVRDEAVTRTDSFGLLHFSFEEVGISHAEFASHALRKRCKDHIKLSLYQLLVRNTGRSLPWGNLTGIRPVKLAMGMLEQGFSNVETAKVFREKYCVSPGKTALAVAIANRERELLKGVDVRNGYSLYIGIPFCPSICLYCSFSSYPLSQWRDQVEAYLDALFFEMEEVSGLMKGTGRKLDTIYIGGGTPTTLEPEQLDRLLHQLGKCFGYDGIKEFTLEAGRPDSITSDKLAAIRRYPVSRISINPQTMNDETLSLIGRRHTSRQIIEAMAQARALGFDNINMDIIIGLPGENAQMVAHTLDEIQSLDPQSLTVHTLAIKRAARLNMFRDQYTELTFESSQEIMDMTLNKARQMGMEPYYLYRQKNMKGNFENVGYAKPHKAGLYNVLIMEERQSIIALGAGGASKLVFPEENRVERVENVKDVKSYISRIEEMIQRKKDVL